jgi:hypothetical protein
MAYFQTKNREILEGLTMEDIGIFMAIWSLLRPFRIFYGLLVYFMVIWYTYLFSSRFDMLYQEKSGNPDGNTNSSSLAST